ncbi:MAG: DUF4846 domain-containing protein [Flavobacteriales bacterium]
MRSPLPITVAFVALSLCAACQTPAQQRADTLHDAHLVANDSSSTVAMRFAPPDGFSRAAVPDGGFEHYLRNLPLKPRTAAVHLFNGSSKIRQDVHAAVIDMSVGPTDLQQCADAVMRLRAEFLFANGRQDDIAFNFTSGFKAEWGRWRKGERIAVEGNACRWVPGSTVDASHAQLLHYLGRVFTYAGTLSLSKELRDAATSPLRPGDVFIQGGSPGHAMLVIDVAEGSDGRMAFLLAQSYMPAQDIHLVKNSRHPELGAWFILNGDDRLYTPEWTFAWSDRKNWP